MPSSRTSSRSQTHSDALTRLARLFKIVTLVASPVAGRSLGRQELASACECDIRTIQRDLALLAEAGIPIDYDARQHTYRMPEKGWVFPVASLTATDTLALALLQGIVTGSGVPQGEALRTTLRKLTGSLPPALTTLMQESAQVIQWGAPDRDYSAAPLADLQEAARRHQTVELDYGSRSGAERSWRRVDPYVVEARAGRYWELHGWCHRNEAVRTFALDQVFGMREIGTGFTLHDPAWTAFSAARGVIGGIRGEEEVPVNVLFIPPVAAYVPSRKWPEGLTVTSEPAGAMRLTGTVLGVSGLVPELLRWRRYCQVEGGPALRAAIAEEVQAMATLYSVEPSGSAVISPEVDAESKM